MTHSGSEAAASIATAPAHGVGDAIAAEGETHVRKGYIPGLDGLRAISVLLVIGGHAGIKKFPASVGVTVFFFISGFLITGLLLNEVKKSGAVDIRAFYARRYLRLMPEMVLYAVVALIASLFLADKPRLIDVIGSLLYFANYLNVFDPTPSLSMFRFGHFWSLAVEEHFYLTWPLLVSLCIGRPRALLASTCAILVIAPVLRAIDLGMGLPTEYVRVASECRIDSIAFGALLAILTHSHRAMLTRFVGTGHLAFAVGMILMVVSTYGGLIGLSGPAHEVVTYCGQGIGLFLIFAYLYVSPGSPWLIDLLELAPLRFIGRVSYGVYIWHFFLVYLVANMFRYARPEDMPLRDQIVAAVLAATLATGAGWLSWRLALRPVASLRRRFGAHIA